MSSNVNPAHHQVYLPPITTPLAPLQGANAVPDGFSELTPDALMFYCETRLRGLDDQMNQYFADQKKANNDSSAINEASAVLNKYQGGIMADENIVQAQEMEDAVQHAIDKCGGPDSPNGKKLADILTKMKATGTGDRRDHSKVADWEVKGFLDDLKNVQGEIQGNSELAMIKLQSLMSQRQAAIQMCTNLVQALGDQANKIVSNVGH